MHRIFKHKTMRMKTSKIHFLFLGLWFASIVFMIFSCSPVDPFFQTYHFNVKDVSTILTNKECEKVFRDTITPPSNPMYEKPVHYDQFAFRGVLCLEKFKGEYYCAIRSVTDNHYFLINDQVTYMMRLDDPTLVGYAVGDTVVVMAMPIKLIDKFSLITFEVQPNNSSSNE